MATVPAEWSERPKVIASLYVSGISSTRETNIKECPTLLTLDQGLSFIAFNGFPSSSVGLFLTCNFGIAASTVMGLPLLRFRHS